MIHLVNLMRIFCFFVLFCLFDGYYIKISDNSKGLKSPQKVVCESSAYVENFFSLMSSAFGL